MRISTQNREMKKMSGWGEGVLHSLPFCLTDLERWYHGPKLSTGSNLVGKALFESPENKAFYTKKGKDQLINSLVTFH